MSWTHCRWCGWDLKTELQRQWGFHDREEQLAYERQRELTMSAALQAFRSEGEPNGGKA